MVAFQPIFDDLNPPPPAPRLDQPFVLGSLETPLGPIPRVGPELSRADRLGALRVRWNFRRMNYKVDPGIYALGAPTPDAPVLVTANYKLSFDALRNALPGLSAWILVLDTQGVNVWCAAGKRTFSTENLADAVLRRGLARLVAHRELILPELGGPGVAAHRLKRASGFKAIWGPVRAADLPAFLAAGRRATPAMRRKTFRISERAVLIPVELALGLKWALLASAALWLVQALVWRTPRVVPSLAVAVVAGQLGSAVLTPLLLPWLPGRAFSLKGVWPALFSVGTLLALDWPGPLEAAAALLCAAAVGSFVAMNFTGSSTFTSLSGVRREMRVAVPLQIAALGLGLAGWIAAIALGRPHA